jgi:hypothetical protein
MLRTELGAEVKMVEGNWHEFAVEVDGQTVAKKRFMISPSDGKVLAAVKENITR